MAALHTPEFWVAIGFIILVLAIAKKSWAAVKTGLDARAERIRTSLDDATKLATARVKPNMPRLGPRLGKDVKSLATTLTTLPEIDAEKVRQQLSSANLAPEEWGGTTGMIEVSAHSGQGVDTLLERLALEAELLDLKASPQKPAAVPNWVAVSWYSPKPS